MGLDQYLYAKRFVSPLSAFNESKEMFYKVVEASNATSFIDDTFPTAYVEVKVAYWRKANQIHQWFVEQVQGHNDDCGEYYVSREQLQELIDLCDSVIASPDLAQQELPTASGFFFGNQEYDEWYFNDVKYTSATLKNILANVPEEWSFLYSSSW